MRAADQLHSALLEPANVAKVEPAAASLVQHMWALSEAVSSENLCVTGKLDISGESCRPAAQHVVGASQRGQSGAGRRSLAQHMLALSEAVRQTYS